MQLYSILLLIYLIPFVLPLIIPKRLIAIYILIAVAVSYWLFSSLEGQDDRLGFGHAFAMLVTAGTCSGLLFRFFKQFLEAIGNQEIEFIATIALASIMFFGVPATPFLLEKYRNLEPSSECYASHANVNLKGVQLRVPTLPLFSYFLPETLFSKFNALSTGMPHTLRKFCDAINLGKTQIDVNWIAIDFSRHRIPWKPQYCSAQKQHIWIAPFCEKAIKEKSESFEEIRTHYPQSVYLDAANEANPNSNKSLKKLLKSRTSSRYNSLPEGSKEYMTEELFNAKGHLIAIKCSQYKLQAPNCTMVYEPIKDIYATVNFHANNNQTLQQKITQTLHVLEPIMKDISQ